MSLLSNLLSSAWAGLKRSAKVIALKFRTKSETSRNAKKNDRRWKKKRNEIRLDPHFLGLMDRFRVPADRRWFASDTYRTYKLAGKAWAH